MLTVSSTVPGLQLYSGNALETAAGGYGRLAGLTLETQHFPDSPNHPAFPNTILRAGQDFSSRTVYAFSAARPGAPRLI
jgi:aldose 1-epimerase